jgi:4-diphosphocytidyl-2-C-methyl-D-erythritol kinase
MYNSPIYCAKSHAKINLFLNILGQRPDGFHQVRFVMQKLALADTLTIFESEDTVLECDVKALETSDNLVLQAHRLFYAATGFTPEKRRYVLEKKIPSQSGLGGGSSNAACALHALNHLHQKKLSNFDLAVLAAQLGSDVAFFIEEDCSTAIALERGEKIQPVKALPPWKVTLVMSENISVSTPWAYQQLKHLQEHDFLAWQNFLADDQPKLSLMKSLLHNDFEAVIFPQNPSLLSLKQSLHTFGPSLMTGTGSCLFTLTEQDVEPVPKGAVCIKTQFLSEASLKI